ncbi:MAG: PmoA family protein [Candidatus Hydrogenedentes bacterium]|nr:PmoA family protein [Candidatus Hydrogenedentota bacterium]
MQNRWVWCLVAAFPLNVFAAGFTFEERPGEFALLRDGKSWLSTYIGPYDETQREESYKVFTHLYDFAGAAPITKGPGGKYTHHRGLFIGWKDTLAEGTDFDTWHMSNCTQRHMTWLKAEAHENRAVQSEEILWCGDDGEPFIKEIRTITAQSGSNETRIFDFESKLMSMTGGIQLKGDLQHAGMQVRLANEVSEHESSTQYVLPEGAQELEDDKVVGAWWVCCSAVVRDQRYWIIHMTPPGNVGGQPVYSIRRYARFGAFLETPLNEGMPLDLSFRIVFSQKELDRTACQALYDSYAASTKDTGGD